MPLPFRLPAVPVIRELLAGILGRAVTVAIAKPTDLGSKGPKIYGVYRDSAQSNTCLCVMDLPLSASSAAAMLVFPLYAVTESIRAGVLEEGLLDPLREILNICSRIFNEDTHHQVFQQLCVTPEDLPPHAAAVLKSPAKRLDLEVDVVGYGGGRLTVLVSLPA